jgi:carbon starvation protein
MSLLWVVVPVAVILITAYLTYGKLLSRLFSLNPEAKTPAVELRDDVDYEPIEPKFLLSQHFSAIAAAGPVVGPILAGLAFGWLPALIWIVVGSIFIGGVHDLAALAASIRHKARSIAEVVRDHMSPRSYYLFLTFVWLALVYIIVAFTDITAATFAKAQLLDNGQSLPAGSIASSSILYLILPIIMGLLMRYAKLPVGRATLIFLPLVGFTVWIGQYIPLDVQGLFNLRTEADAIKFWDVVLLLYCLVAAVVPLWLLLQPRGHLGGYFLYVSLGGAALGLVFGGLMAPVLDRFFGTQLVSEPLVIRYTSFTGWVSPAGKSLVPILFITIACGACSGFHALIASGTTSKQLRRETDARPIAYGAMLLEAMVAVISLSCVMLLAPGEGAGKDANYVYALGMGTFLRSLGISQTLAVSFALMAFTTFVYDTLDVCTRLGRYVIQELTGWRDAKGRWVGTLLTTCAPLFFVLQSPVDETGNPIPAWKTFWELFGASNQLLAALTLLGITVWLWRTRKAVWVWFVTGLPTVFMYVMSAWALIQIIAGILKKEGGPRLFGLVSADPVLWVAVMLVGLAALMLLEAVWILAWRTGSGTPPRGHPVSAGA